LFSLRTFDGWVAILDFYLQVFCFHFLTTQAVSVFFCKSSQGGGRVSIFNFDDLGLRIPGTLKEGINGPLSLQSYASDMMVCNPLVRQVHVHSFPTQEWSMINSQH
jgi:hypothetical protein